MQIDPQQVPVLKKQQRSSTGLYYTLFLQALP